MSRNLRNAKKKAQTLSLLAGQELGETTLPSRVDMKEIQDHHIKNLLLAIKSDADIDIKKLDPYQIKVLDRLIDQSGEASDKRIDLKIKAVKENALDFVLREQEVVLPRMHAIFDKMMADYQKTIATLEEEFNKGNIETVDYIRLKNEQDALVIEARKHHFQQGMTVANNKLITEAVKISVTSYNETNANTKKISSVEDQTIDVKVAETQEDDEEIKKLI